MRKLENLRKDLEEMIPHHALINTKVSKASVGWHLEHSLMVMNGILGVLAKSASSEYKWKFNKTRLYIFTKNRIPRGRGRAPEIVTPKSEFSLSESTLLLDKINGKLDKLNQLDKNQFFKHPIFGQLNKRQSLRFIAMHTRHHLEIMNEIVELETKS